MVAIGCAIIDIGAIVSISGTALGNLWEDGGDCNKGKIDFEDHLCGMEKLCCMSKNELYLIWVLFCGCLMQPNIFMRLQPNAENYKTYKEVVNKYFYHKCILATGDWNRTGITLGI